MVRSVFIQRKVLELYGRMDTISYPIQPETLLPCVPQSCCVMSYQKTAEVAGCSVQDIAFFAKAIPEQPIMIQSRTDILSYTMNQ